MTPLADIDTALCDQGLLGAALGDAASWSTWRTTLKAAFGIDLTADEARTFASVAGGRKPPTRRVRELWTVIGRRSGKSRIAAALAVYIAAFVDHGARLAPGETGTVLVLAASRAQAAVVFNYCRAFLEASPTLAQLVEETTAEEIRLKGGIAIAVHATSFRTVRGRTLLACIFDEVGFWRDESTAQPDIEVYRAVLPALATTEGMLIAISSPYAQRGLLFTKHRESFGRDDQAVLVVQAPTEVFNPSIDKGVIETAERDDPEAARAEWFAEFRGDLSTFVDRSVVENAVERGRRERGYVQGPRYSAFADPSGGQHDSFTLAIAHRENERVLLDAVREWKAPFDPAVVVEDVVQVLRSYRCTAVRGDRYAGAWVKSEFSKHTIHYVEADRTRSEIYLDVLPLLMSGNGILLDNPRLVGQLSQLERRTMRTGRDAVDHMRGAADDLANAAAGAMVYAKGVRASASMWEAGDISARVIHAYAKTKARQLGRPMRGVNDWPRKSDRPPADVRAAVELTSEPPQWTPVGGEGHGISYYDKDNAGRERWAVHDAQRVVVTRVWERGAAEAACRQLIEQGAISRS